jgi:3-hydroxyisobutyrate dehydrogenase
MLGTGTMGSAMAANLCRAGFDVTVWNRTAQSPGVAASVAAGCKVAPTVEAAVAEAEVVGICVADVPDVEGLLFGASNTPGAANAAPIGACFIDFSTGSPASAQRFDARLVAMGKQYKFLDAPVTGGDTGARDGTLTIIAGGDAETVTAMGPIFNAIGNQVRHCGPVGSGQSVKLVNQLLCAVHAVALAEAITLSESLGINPRLAIEVCATGAGSSWALKNLAPRAIEGDLGSGFAIELMLKDLRLIRETGNTLPGAELAGQLFAIARDALGKNAAATQAIVRAYGPDPISGEPIQVWPSSRRPYRG